MLVERTVGKSGLLRDFGATNTVDPFLAEQTAGGPQQRASVFLVSLFRNEHPKNSSDLCAYSWLQSQLKSSTLLIVDAIKKVRAELGWQRSHPEPYWRFYHVPRCPLPPHRWNQNSADRRDRSRFAAYTRGRNHR